MPTNLFGPGDNYDLKSSHVLPALIRKAHEAKLRGDDRLVVWGTGNPRREFLHSDDMADGCIFLLTLPEVRYRDLVGPSALPLINIGAGKEITIGELAQMVAEVVGFRGKVVFDASKPDGTPRKLLDTSRIEGLGWRSSIKLRTGIERTYSLFQEEAAAGRIAA